MKKVILVLMFASTSLVLAGCGNEEEVEYIDYSDVFEFSDREIEDIFTNEMVEGISIDKYLGSESIVQIPEEINGKPVIHIVDDFLKIDILISNYDVEVLIISKNVMSIGGYFNGAPNLSSIVIDEDNEYLLSFQNGIYQKIDSGLKLLAIQIGNDIDYVLHEDTISLDWDFNYEVLKSITIPEGTRISDVHVLIYSGSIYYLDNIYVYQIDYDYYVDFITNRDSLVDKDLIIAKLSVVDPS